jgi:hypothetical protein
MILFCLFSVAAFFMYLLLIFLAGNNLPMYLRPNLSYRAGAYGHMNSRLKEVKNYGKVDILFLGSSHAYRGFDPRIFREAGIKSFNLGSSSQTPVQSLVLLEKYLKRLQPTLVIYEVYPEIFTLDGVESSQDVVSNDSIDLAILKMVVATNHVKTYNTFFYSWMRELQGNRNDFREGNRVAKDTYVPGGYVERDYEYFGYKHHNPFDLILQKKQLKAFNNLLALLKKHNTPVMLVQAPVTRSFYRAMLNASSFDSIMSSKGSYLNFNYLLNLDDSLHFYDADHLNSDGVKIFNRRLIEVIKDSSFVIN